MTNLIERAVAVSRRARLKALARQLEHKGCAVTSYFDPASGYGCVVFTDTIPSDLDDTNAVRSFLFAARSTNNLIADRAPARLALTTIDDNNDFMAHARPRV